jgi:hypothetical protein
MDELELTRRVLGGREPDPAALERLRSRLRAEIERERRRGRRRWREALGVAAVLAVVGLVIASLLPTSKEAAAAELRRLGAIAADQAPVRAGPGEFLLIRSEQLRREGFAPVGVGGTFDLVTRLRVSTWVAPDGSAFRREEVVSSDFASEADRLGWIEAGRPELEVPRVHEFPPGEGPVIDAGQLPEDPDALLAALRSGAVVEGPPGDDQAFVVIGEILAQGVAPSETRSALFEAAARLEGVSLVGTVRDPLGRTGTGIEAGTVNSRTRLVFDSDSAQLLAIEIYQIRPDGGEEPSSWTAAWPSTVVEDAPRLDR